MTGFSCDAGMLNLRAVSEAAAHPSGTRETSDETLMLAYAVLPVPNGIFLKKSILFGFSFGVGVAAVSVGVGVGVVAVSVGVGVGVSVPASVGE